MALVGRQQFPGQPGYQKALQTAPNDRQPDQTKKAVHFMNGLFIIIYGSVDSKY
jgi:hypothetical protein